MVDTGGWNVHPGWSKVKRWGETTKSITIVVSIESRGRDVSESCILFTRTIQDMSCKDINLARGMEGGGSVG